MSQATGEREGCHRKLNGRGVTRGEAEGNTNKGGSELGDVWDSNGVYLFWGEVVVFFFGRCVP